MVNQIKNLNCTISVMDGPPGEGPSHPWQSFMITSGKASSPSCRKVGTWWKADQTEDEIATNIGKAILLMLQGDE